ncbi:MAG: diheme cytochrome c, partial [Deltaproteobacteria bacterium]|nr:diheme cytochrome c [Deltaproteobacteria bacterium]
HNSSLMDFQLPFGRGWIIAQTGSGQGAQEIPAVWTQECSPCHHAYHPSVLPTRSWEVMLDRLESHFKQNVWLDPETVLEMKDFVRKTSADTAPGELAAWLRVTLDQSQAPQRVTETWYWKEKHHDLGEKEFTTYPAKGRIECDRCHAFAERGSFEDTHILYPFRR